MTYADWRGRFLEAVDEAFYPASWLDKRVANGRARFWGNDRAAILAEIRTYPSGAKEVHGLVAAGEVEAIRGLILLAEEWGRRCGAVRASISSVPAWERIMRADGYSHFQTTIVKDL